MSPAEKSERRFYEHPLFKGTAAVVALVGAVLALTGQLGKLVDDLIPDPPKKAAWTEIVLNTSAVMGDRFGRGGETALDSSVHALETVVNELDNEGVGLRVTPSSCDGDSRKLIDIADGSPEAVIRKAREQVPAGSASIAYAVFAGLKEFEREPMQRHDEKSKSLLVFTTASPPCEWDDLVADEVSEKIARIKNVGAVEVLALRSQSEQRTVSFEAAGADELDVLEAALGPRMGIHYVDTPDELYEQAEAAGETVRETADEAEDPDDGPSG